MRLLLIQSFLLWCCMVPVLAQAPQVQPLSIGEVLVEPSKVLGEERRLNIYLPEGYHPDSAQTYPVVYVLDGSMHEDFLHVVGVYQFGAFSWIDRNPTSIVVGISNVNRYRDFTYPSDLAVDQEINPVAGGSEAFIRYLKDEVQPMINTRYKTNGTSTLIGQSLGGLLAAEILYTQPQLFNNYLIVSPSLWWNGESLLQRDLPPSAADRHIAIAVGAEGPTMKRVARQLYKKTKQFAKHPKPVSFRYFKHCDHGDVLHEAVYWGVTQL